VCPTPPAATGGLRWRYRMWAVCGAVMVVTLILLGLDIAAARGADPLPAGVLDWSLAGFALAILLPAMEGILRHYVGVLRADLAQIHVRLDSLEGADPVRRETSDDQRSQHSQDWWNGYAAQVEDRPPPVTGGDVLHLPTQRSGPPRARTDRRAQKPGSEAFLAP
jgi:hypothetical protein